MNAVRSAPVLTHIVGVIILSVAITLTVSFVLLVIAPPPAPMGMTIAEVAEATASGSRSRDGTKLSVHRRPSAPIGEPEDIPSVLIASALAGRLGVPAAQVRVRLLAGAPPSTPGQVLLVPGRETIPRGALALPSEAAQPEMRVLRRPLGEIFPPDLPLPPFEAAVARQDGGWVYVSPRQALITPWRMRILMASLGALALLTPAAFLVARSLAGPLRRFAHAADHFAVGESGGEIPMEGPRELRQVGRALNRMRSRLRQHVEQRTMMLTAIAHDLRTPLTSLRLRIEAAPESARDKMAADIGRMERMIAQILTFANGEGPAQRAERVVLDDVVRDYVDGRRAAGDPVSLVSQPCGVQVTIAPDDLVRILANLIDNALRYGGSAVSIEIESGRACALIRVLDQGAGVSDAELERLFEPFYRLERSRSGATGGAGLGLAIARSLARRAGGDVTLANRAEGGLCAAIELPLS